MWFILSLLEPSPTQDIEQVGLKRQDTSLIGEDPRVLASISHGGEDTDDSQYESDEEQDNEFPQSEDDDSPEFSGEEMSILFLCQLFTFSFLPVTHHHNLRQLVRYSNFCKASNESSGNGREGPSVSLVDNHAVKHSGCQTVL